jgi:chemotaxis regulatin CheY-phosphate phosphatase CheZ
MELNTKQVRAIVNNIAGFGAQYTDATSENNKQRRSVIWCFRYSDDADNTFKRVQDTFAKMGAKNVVKRTGTGPEMWGRSGGYYVRVIADIA